MLHRPAKQHKNHCDPVRCKHHVHRDVRQSLQHLCAGMALLPRGLHELWCDLTNISKSSYIGVENGYLCYCGNSIQSPNYHIAENLCNVTCTGNSTEIWYIMPIPSRLCIIEMWLK